MKGNVSAQFNLGVCVEKGKRSSKRISKKTMKNNSKKQQNTTRVDTFSRLSQFCLFITNNFDFKDNRLFFILWEIEKKRKFCETKSCFKKMKNLILVFVVVIITLTLAHNVTNGSCDKTCNSGASCKVDQPSGTTNCECIPTTITGSTVLNPNCRGFGSSGGSCSVNTNADSCSIGCDSPRNPICEGHLYRDVHGHWVWQAVCICGA